VGECIFRCGHCDVLFPSDFGEDLFIGYTQLNECMYVSVDGKRFSMIDTVNCICGLLSNVGFGSSITILCSCCFVLDRLVT